MADAKKKMTREQARATIRKSMAPNVKPWPMGLDLNVGKITRLAADEWSFEKFYAQVQRFAGASVTREILLEFMKAKQIVLKSRPKGGGKMI
jgi:hypothetical protein